MATEPTAQDQYMLELLNRARSNPQAEADRHPQLGGNLNEGLAPGTISTAAKQPLAFNLQLFQAAEGHSKWMLSSGIFDHTGNGGSSSGDRATAAGYPWSRVGENIAWQGTTGTPDWTGFVGQEHNDLFVDSGIAGRGHRVSMMDGNFREIGISSVVGQFQGYNSVMTTQLFGSDSNPNSFLTGVVYTDKVANDDFYTVGEGLGNITITAVGNGQTFSTKSLTAGGYNLRLTPGDYNVTFTGDFDGDGKEDTTAARAVTIGNQNVKVDFATDTYIPVATPPTPIAATPPAPVEPPTPIAATPPAPVEPPTPIAATPPAPVEPPTPIAATPPTPVEPPTPIAATPTQGDANLVLQVTNLDNVTGGSGDSNRSFVFHSSDSTAIAPMGIGSLLDRGISLDRVLLSKLMMHDLLTTDGLPLSANNFAVVTADDAAAICPAAIVYNSNNGKLFYNENGNNPGFGEGGQLAQLNAGLNLNQDNFRSSF
jgi:uncharacterized protein YkwD